MSFQGDVGGIGLADLLQSLVRGRDGVVTLSGRAPLRATVGILSGQIHLLPEQDEDAEFWRNRVRQAWIDDPDFRVDSLRMEDLARAQRIETIYNLLDSEQVHFRFAHGPVPTKAPTPTVSASEPGTERPGHRGGVFCPPMSVEQLLLEYARLKDEGESAHAGVPYELPDHAVLVICGDTPQGSDFKRLFDECDGRSTLVEISDRLGWPLRQSRNIALVALAQSALRPASLPELLDLAAREMLDGNSARAATRLRCWIEFGVPGPLSEADTDFFATQWHAARLQPVLGDLPKSAARTFLRRLEVSSSEQHLPVELWTEFLRTHGGDRLAAVSLLVAQIRGAMDAHTPALKDILTVAKSFQHDGFPLRAAALWRVAAARNPDALEARLEVGLGLLAAGLATEGVPWVVDAASTLLEQGHPEQAIEPLRRAIEADNTNRDARRLLSRARTQVVQRTITRKNSLVTIAIVLSLAIGGVVTYRVQATNEQRFAEVAALMNQPHDALKILNEQFALDDSARVRELRAQLTERCRVIDNAARTAWTDRYREAQLECTIGDAKLGLERALALPAPPQLAPGQDNLPLVPDLYNGLSARLDNMLKELGAEVVDVPDQITAETHVLELVSRLRDALDEKNASSSEAREFATRLSACEKKVRDREQVRLAARVEKARRDALTHQDVLLATARTQAQAGAYALSLDAYNELVQSDSTGKLKGLLKKEMDAVVTKGGAVLKARELALAGKHPEAIKVLRDGVDNATAYPLPWKLESFPSGARVKLRDGADRTTPCTFETAIEETFDITIERDGCESATVHVDGPSGRFVYLSRVPERAWKVDGRVEALPARSGADHLVCDRAGNVARLSSDAARAWQRKLGSLSGVARTPLALPADPTHVLVVGEDGQCWLLDAATGALDGPKELRAPPLEGPIATADTAVVRLRDGSLCAWSTHAEPDVVAARDLGPQHAEIELALANSGAFGARTGFTVLRQRTDTGTRITSADGEWTIEIGPSVYLVRRKGATEPVFCVARQGEWSYVAWEEPQGGSGATWLWISDQSGLRGFRP